MTRLQEHGLSINTSKCIFGKEEVKYLGQTISKEGIAPLKNHITVIMNYPKPRTVMELRRFLGLINFYKRFIKNTASSKALQEPSNETKDRLRGHRRPNRFLNNAATCANVLLAHPCEGAPLLLHTDASDFAMSAALQQFQEDKWIPLGFYSKKLINSQSKYSTYDRKFLAIYSSIRFFRHMLECREFTIATDHKPLTFVFNQKPYKASPRQLHQLASSDNFLCKSSIY